VPRSSFAWAGILTFPYSHRFYERQVAPRAAHPFGKGKDIGSKPAWPNIDIPLLAHYVSHADRKLN